MTSLWQSPWALPADARFVTYGSCFAQHISRALIARRLNWLNCEAAPAALPPQAVRKFNYGVFSARTGNIYTARQLLHWVRLASDPALIDLEEIWPGVSDTGSECFKPALCPLMEPQGFATMAEARGALTGTARAFRHSIMQADVFIFTLGLTEGWLNRKTNAPYAMCPGTIAGRFDPELHGFENASYPDIRSHLETAFGMMRRLNPDLRILLTVSPVPLTATASDDHVLPATIYSKSTLRAVAGDLSGESDHVDYFPSYEIIAAPPTRGAFFAPNLRSVEQAGVSLVMTHFFAGLNLSQPARGRQKPLPSDTDDINASLAEEDLICEEETLENSNGA